MTSGKDELGDFYATLKSGTSVASFLEQYKHIIGFIHAEGLTEDYRLARGRVKRLSDEVSPVARFVRKHAAPEDRIWFALDYTAPDCCVRHGDDRLREIEVTVAQGNERFNVVTELNQTGIGRGFLGLSDDAPTEHFVRKMAQQREAYTEDEIGRMIIRAVAICARKKSKSRGDTLLIEAPLQTLPADRWGKFTAALSEEVKELAFSEVYVTGSGSDGDICLRIK